MAEELDRIQASVRLLRAQRMVRGLIWQLAFAECRIRLEYVSVVTFASGTADSWRMKGSQRRGNRIFAVLRGRNGA